MESKFLDLFRNKKPILGMIHLKGDTDEDIYERMKKEVQIWTIKDNYRLGEDIQSKVLAFAFGLSAEIERNLISQRTKEALARKKAEGVILGRPVGKKSSKVKLSGKELQVKKLLDKNVSYSAIGRILGVNRITVTKFAKERITLS